jgi:hypothetical protein
MRLSAKENANFVRAIAQRNQIYNSRHGVGMGETDNIKVRNISTEFITRRDTNGVAVGRKIYGRGKYCPVNWKASLAEFRIFQSTTNEMTFVKNLEFVWALQAWTKPEAATGSSFNHLDFINWLNEPAQRKEFPNLVAFLSKKVFYGTNCPPIISSWHSLMRKPDEGEAVESMAA